MIGRGRMSDDLWKDWRITPLLLRLQVANHLRNGDLLTIKSGLHDCMHSLKKSTGLDPATFYPRSYYFGPGEKDRQMHAFVDDFKNCTATALLWTAATSPDGDYIGGGAGEDSLDMLSPLMSIMHWFGACLRYMLHLLPCDYEIHIQSSSISVITIRCLPRFQEKQLEFSWIGGCWSCA